VKTFVLPDPIEARLRDARAGKPSASARASRQKTCRGGRRKTAAKNGVKNGVKNAAKPSGATIAMA